MAQIGDKFIKPVFFYKKVSGFYSAAAPCTTKRKTCPTRFLESLPFLDNITKNNKIDSRGVQLFDKSTNYEL